MPPGNTPTGVGKTSLWERKHARHQKHPHGRGEDRFLTRNWNELEETPPRAWGRPPYSFYLHGELRNTPTGVGKTERRSSQTSLISETPPRAWGRLPERFLGIADKRNTPTGVGKTPLSVEIMRSRRKHPHGRGEDGIHLVRLLLAEETPPRAWGRLSSRKENQLLYRNTPTGVGKTLTGSGLRVCTGKHPHGRGEDQPTQGRSLQPLETPPRAWGRLRLVAGDEPVFGNTPTGVGKTRWSWASLKMV